MIIIIKRTSLLLLLIICIISYGIFQIHFKGVMPTTALPTTNKVIVLDAGHGYPDGGATGTTGLMEKDVNLIITKNLQALIEQGGGSVILTRTDDNSIHDPNKTSIKEQKISDLENRVKIMNESKADIFVSIHLNKFSQSQYYGAQVFYSINDEESKILAESIQTELKNNIDNENKREVKPADQGIFILKNANIPAVIVECGFLSNPEEEGLLATDKYQKQIAWVIYRGLTQYFYNRRN